MKWQDYQYGIYEYLQHFYPNCKLTHNVYLDSLSGGSKRQIDVLIEYELLGFSKYAIVDCKNYSHRIDKKGIEEFSGLVDDVGATHGIMITKTGFTDGAIKRAKIYNMNLEIVNIEAITSDFYYNFECRGYHPIFWGTEKGHINATFYFQHQ